MGRPIFGLALAVLGLIVIRPSLHAQVLGVAGSPASSINLSGAAVRGNPRARVVIMEFSDYECPFCGLYASQVLPRINREYVDTGKVRYSFHDAPGYSIHPLAAKAAEAARCAGEQGKYWEMHDRLYVDQNSLQPPQLASHALALNLDPSLFEVCMNTSRYESAVREDRKRGIDAGLRATPSFFIGTSEPGETTMTIVSVIRGSVSYETLQSAIEKQLAVTDTQGGRKPD